MAEPELYSSNRDYDKVNSVLNRFFIDDWKLGWCEIVPSMGMLAEFEHKVESFPPHQTGNFS